MVGKFISDFKKDPVVMAIIFLCAITSPVAWLLLALFIITYLLSLLPAIVKFVRTYRSEIKSIKNED